ncbi:MAG: NAD-dependent protein deacylase [Christensenella sp.]|nr:NAD-dependent protein deacylase [Christensenella sp.]
MKDELAEHFRQTREPVQKAEPNGEYAEQLQQLRGILARSKRIVFLGGAGVSTESGIPDFRSSDGVYAAMKQYGHAPEVLLSHTFFLSHPDEFFAYYRAHLLHPKAQPNDAHRALARLEAEEKLIAVVTQNIDGLHQKAGSKNVLELHGSVYRNHCMACGKAYSLEEVLKKDGVPHCYCGGIIKPDVVLYEEPLDERVWRAAMLQIHRADTLIVGGTSLLVYPAAGLVDYFQGSNLVVINLTQTSRNACANLAIAAPIGRVFKEAVLCAKSA